MNRRTTGFALASLTAGAFVMLGSAPASAYDHIDAALDFVTVSLDYGTQNEWGSPCSVDWSTYDGTTKAACFFTLMLKHAKNYADADLVAMWGSSSPTSDHFYTLISTSPSVNSQSAPSPETYFRRVTTPLTILRGDVLAIATAGTYSGHLAMITGAAKKLTTQLAPIYAGTDQWAVPIADSTTAAHGCSAAYPDSRWVGPCPPNPNGAMNPGAGTATIRVYSDSLTGIFLGFTWSVTASSSSYYSPSVRPYVVGRLTKLPDPHP